MNEDLRMLLGFYLSTSISSVIMNAYIDSKMHRKAKKKSMKKLVYKKGLCSEAKKELNLMNQEHFFDVFSDVVNSVIPFKNIYVTYSNIDYRDDMQDFVEEVYDEIVMNVNEIEDEYRRSNVELLKQVRDSLSVIPTDLDLDDERTRLTKSETKRIMKLNKINYKKMMDRFSKEEC